MTGFGAKVRRERGLALVDLRGVLDREAEPAFTAAFEDALRRGEGPIVLNFSDVGFINSTGIALVVGALARGRTERREVRAFGLTAHYRHIFAITRLSDFIGIFDDELAAVVGQEEQHA